MALIGNNDKEKIWNYLVPYCGAIGTAGLMGNLQNESGLSSYRLQGDFSTNYQKSRDYAANVDSGRIGREDFARRGPGGGGWGLAQWTYYTRKYGLYDLAKSRGASIGDLETQLIYLVTELQGYNLINKLKNCKTIYEASTIILTQFEKPRDQSESVKQLRANLGQAIYNECAGAVPTQPTPAPVPTAASPINIVKVTSTTNTTAKANRPINWIVIHYTAGTTSRTGTARNVANYFSKSTTKASADFIVDDSTIVQFNPDIKNRYCWSVGGGKYSTNSTSLASQYYQKCMNNNSISIEICSSKRSTKTLNATDRDWYFTDAVLNNAILLTKYLMQVYNIDLNHVIMHHHVMGKLCPAMWTWDEASLAGWYNFKNRLAGGSVPTPTPAVPPSTNYDYVVNNIDYSRVFNPDFYYAANGDLQKAIGNNRKKLFEHFLNYGMKEGRAAHPNFNVLIYKANNGDLLKAYGNDLKQYYIHFCIYGYKEGRKCV